MSEQKFHTVLEVARELKVTKPTIYDWLDKGKFPNATHAHDSLKVILIPSDDVQTVKEAIAQEKINEVKRLGFWAEWGKEYAGSSDRELATAI